MNKRFRLHRRALLRGLGGATVALPFLEAMGDDRRAWAAAADARYYVVIYGGVSLGSHAELVTPATTGASWEVTRGLRPLLGNSLADKHTTKFSYPSLKQDFSILSGLKIPWEAGAPARRGDFWHGCTVSPLASGTPPLGRHSAPQGPTSDFLVHRAIGGDRRHLKYRVQPDSYDGNPNSYYGRQSAGVDAAGKLVQYTPVANPQQAHRELFQGFRADAGQDAAAWQLAQDQRKSVIDLVRRSGDRLHQRLGTADRRRLARHFDEIRAAETRIGKLTAPVAASGTCMKSPEPPILAVANAPNQKTNGASAWSDEETRASIMVDLVHLALACDLAAVVNLQLTYTTSYVTAKHVTERGVVHDFHECGHMGHDPADMADVYAWHLKHVAALVHKLKSTMTPTGSLLDQCAVVFVTEGGHGKDAPGSDGSHSSQNMMALLAGRAGGHKPGRHFNFGNRVHPAAAVLSAMKAVGVGGPLGEISQPVMEIFA